MSPYKEKLIRRLKQSYEDGSKYVIVCHHKHYTSYYDATTYKKLLESCKKIYNHNVSMTYYSQEEINVFHDIADNEKLIDIDYYEFLVSRSYYEYEDFNLEKLS